MNAAPSFMSGYEFRSIRETLSMTQEDLAKHLGLNPRTIIRYEHDKSPINQATAMAMRQLLARADQVDLDKSGRVLGAVKSWMQPPQKTVALVEAAFGKIRMGSIKVEQAEELPLHNFRLLVPITARTPLTLAVTARAVPSASPVTIAGALITALEVLAIEGAPTPKRI